jgi:hypothetical protein
MSVNTGPQRHRLECIRVDQTYDGDLEFEFICPDCGFREILSLYESFAKGDIYLSHTDGADGSSYISINLMRTQQILPECFKNFLDALDDEL